MPGPELNKTSEKSADTFDSDYESGWASVKNVEFAGGKDHNSISNYDEKSIDLIGQKEINDILNDEKKLQKIADAYVNQYDPNATTIAEDIAKKEALDNFALKWLSQDNPKMFIESKQFKNYAKHITTIASEKKFESKNKKHCVYSEYCTNPVFRDPSMRNLILRAAIQDSPTRDLLSQTVPGGNLNHINAWIDQIQKEYDHGIKNLVEKGIEQRKPLNQMQMDMIGDYIYSGKNYDDGIAKKYAEHCFNNIPKNSQLKASVPMVGALSNYFAHCYTIDEDVRKNSRFIIASHPDGIKGHNFKVGVSTQNGCILEKEHFLDMSLTSEDSLDKSRTNQSNDLCRLMMVSFHELTHDHQKNMADKGKHNSSAMAHILNKVLRQNDKRYYKENHDNDEIEIQADEESWRQCRAFLNDHQLAYIREHFKNPQSQNDRIEKEKLEKQYSSRWNKCLGNQEEVRFRRAFTEKVTADGEVVSPIQYDMTKLRGYIKNDPRLLQKYPQLNDYFETSGDFKLDLLFNRRIADTEYSNNNLDERLDAFGAEVGSYLLTNTTETNRIVECLHKQGRNLSPDQVANLRRNLHNIVHQEAVYSRILPKIDFDHYDETRAQGKNQSEGAIRNHMFKNYIKKCYHAIHIAEELRSQQPTEDAKIIEDEKWYIGYYYDELAREGRLSPAFAKATVDTYTRTKNPVLVNIANKIKLQYNIK